MTLRMSNLGRSEKSSSAELGFEAGVSIGVDVEGGDEQNECLIIHHERRI